MHGCAEGVVMHGCAGGVAIRGCATPLLQDISLIFPVTLPSSLYLLPHHTAAASPGQQMPQLMYSQPAPCTWDPHANMEKANEPLLMHLTQDKILLD